MKVTFEVPDDVGSDFQNAVPVDKQAKLIADFMADQARARLQRDLEACRVANEVDKKDPSLREWEKF